MKLNTLMLATLIASTSLATAMPAVADDAHHPERVQATQSAPTQATAKATAKASEQTVKAMQKNVEKMQIQLDRVAKAKTDDERQKAMAEHMLTMRENMQMASGMQAGTMGCPMMGAMGQGGMGMMMGSGGPMGNTDDRMQQMEKRMDMMEMMMKSGGQGMPGMGKP